MQATHSNHGRATRTANDLQMDLMATTVELQLQLQLSLTQKAGLHLLRAKHGQSMDKA